MSKAKQTVRDAQFRYKQGLGQNFIYDETLLSDLVQKAGLTKADNVLEIGPGSGTLTACLARSCNRVLALEIDEKLLPILRVTLEGFKNAQVRLQDVMTSDLPALADELGDGFSVAANIPYYITTPIINKILDSHLPIRQLAVMVQKEVAEKILAQPGEENYGPLAIKCQYFCQPEIAAIVGKEYFTPVPKVDSAFVLLPLREKPLSPVRDEKMFFKVVHAAFLMRRKTMANNMTSVFGLTKEESARLLCACGLNEKIRGEAMTIEEMGALADLLTEDVQ